MCNVIQPMPVHLQWPWITCLCYFDLSSDYISVDRAVGGRTITVTVTVSVTVNTRACYDSFFLLQLIYVFNISEDLVGKFTLASSSYSVLESAGIITIDVLFHRRPPGCVLCALSAIHMYRHAHAGTHQYPRKTDNRQYSGRYLSISGPLLSFRPSDVRARCIMGFNWGQGIQ